MEKKDYRIRGHESFILRDGWLTKGLYAVNSDAKVFSKNSGADALGVGTNMAKAIRYWMRAAGLISDSQKGVFLTDLGTAIFEWDPFFEDVFSLWVSHVNIAKNMGLATSWNVFFNSIDAVSFRRDELNSMMMDRLIQTIGSEPPERSVKDDCSAILQMYVDSEADNAGKDPEEKRKSPFSALGLITKNDKDVFTKCHPAIDELDPMIVMYILCDRLQEEGVLQIDAIANDPDMPGKLLNLNRVLINDYLDDLQHKGYVVVNRTAGLDVVYPDRKISPIEVIKEHYERSQRV